MRHVEVAEWEPGPQPCRQRAAVALVMQQVYKSLCGRPKAQRAWECGAAGDQHMRPPCAGWRWVHAFGRPVPVPAGADPQQPAPACRAGWGPVKPPAKEIDGPRGSQGVAR